MNENRRTNAEIVNEYRPMVDFIADILGPGCEVVLHDLTLPDQSVIAIRNGHLSGRSIGSPATDLTLRMMKSGDQETYIANYSALAANGKKFRSSSCLIRNPDREVVGVFCVNIDIQAFCQVRDFLDYFVQADGLRKDDPDMENQENGPAAEYLQGSVCGIVEKALETARHQIGTDRSHMTVEEKRKIIRFLHDNGIFMLKGGVSEVAKSSGISEPTIYRYLKNIR